ncbi:MAG: hypothetical protein H7A23_10940 [Leptospiraceae bacterium]|nr:hypothetical protein [Leptospiraceae bacterium]MCP5495061.1 hypothetical protein [Leptospiraceae bacterium]
MNKNKQLHKVILSIILFLGNSIFAIEPVILTENKGEYPLGLHLEILEDKEGKLTINDVQKSEMEKFWLKSKSEVPNFGFSDSAFWLRFEIQNSLTKSNSWFLEVAFPPIDYIDFYLTDENGKYSLTQTGDRRPFHSRQYNTRNYLFNISVEAKKSKVVYIKTWSHDGLHESLPIVLYNKGAYINKSSNTNTLMGIHIGILSVMMFYNLFIYFSVKNNAYLYYVLYLFGFIGWVLTYYGYGTQILWQDSPWWANQVLILFVIFFVIMANLFSKAFLSTSQLTPRMDIILKIILVVYGTFFLLSFILSYSIIWKIIIPMGLLTTIFLIFTGILCYRKGYRPARYYLLAWTCLLSGALLLLLKIVKILPSNFLTENLFSIGSALEVFLLSLGLADRINILKIELAVMNSELEKRVVDRTIQLELANKEVKEAKNETDRLNELSKLVNSTNDLDRILRYVYNYIERNLRIELLWLTIVDEKTSELYTYDVIFPPNIMENIDKEFIYYFRGELSEKLGTLYQTYIKQIPFYNQDSRIFRNVDNNTFLKNHYNGEFYSTTKMDLKIMFKFKLQKFLQIPLVLHGQTIGILNLSSYQDNMNISKEYIQSIVRLCENITGAIQNSILLQQTEEAKKQAETERQKSEKLLLNILPDIVAKELKEKGKVQPILYESVSVIFTDFKGFTKVAESMSVEDLVKELDASFYYFDDIITKYNLEKIKTIGDSYMCAGGLPDKNPAHLLDCCLAALEIQNTMSQAKAIKSLVGLPYWELRIGIHVGPVIAGVVGKNKFAYDIWGDTVNTASRMESSGEAGMINISSDVYEQIKYFFDCEYRGKIKAKNKGEIDMYFLHRLKKKYAINAEGIVPNDKFKEIYEKIRGGARIPRNNKLPSL